MRPTPRRSLLAVLRGRRPLDVYLFAVGTCGVAVLANVLAVGSGQLTWSFASVALVTLLVIGELMPIRVPGHDDEVTTSAAFSLALLLLFGLAPAAAAQAIASAIADARLAKPVRVIVFNVGQYTIALALAAAVVSWSEAFPRHEASHPIAPLDLAILALASLVYFAVNNSVAGTAYALAIRERIRAHLRNDLGFQAWTAALVMAFAPLVVGTAEYNPVLIPFLLVPLLAIYRAGRDARTAEHQALHDGLTGLPNRALFRERFEGAVAAAAGSGSTVAVLVMDLNRFKEINDTLGHHHGDLLLQQVAERLNDSLRDTETIARFGGDEFAVLLPALRSGEEGEAVAMRLLNALAEPIAVDTLTLRVEASIGLACFPGHGRDVDELLRRADVAMYVAKSRNLGVQPYTPGDDEHSLDRLALAGDLREAIDAGQLTLHYQPLIELATGRLAGAEALVRWEHPERGLVLPGEFIATAENTGAIRGVTSRALEMAVAQAARWRAQGLSIPVSVNVSVQDVVDAALPNQVAALLDRHGLSPDALKLELTESMLMTDSARSHDVLHTLNGMGVRIAIDDFGTGYSSLAYLTRLPVDQLKIDRAFIAGLDERNNSVIVASTIELARQLGLRTVAEGVEDQGVAEALAAQRCDLAQGYHYSRPLPAQEFTAWAQAHAAQLEQPLVEQPLAA
jgi:diguanylate cyclase (GGDEF)-like protein